MNALNNLRSRLEFWLLSTQETVFISEGEYETTSGKEGMVEGGDRRPERKLRRNPRPWDPDPSKPWLLIKVRGGNKTSPCWQKTVQYQRMAHESSCPSI